MWYRGETKVSVRLQDWNEQEVKEEEKEEVEYERHKDSGVGSWALRWCEDATSLSIETINFNTVVL